MKRTKIKALLQLEPQGQEVLAQGWVKSHRVYPDVSFITLNDGSCVSTLQIITGAEWRKDQNEEQISEVLKQINVGACIGVKGKLVPSDGKGQKMDLRAEEITVYGPYDQEFPLQKKAASLEFLREIGHLRVRTNVFGAVFRIRHSMAFAVHKFFHDKGFYYVHTPIITGSDTEGAGEMFTVTTLPLDKVPKLSDGSVNFGEDFFGKHTKLTVSGQLNGELYAMGLGEIYTFGPTFRAENSNTTRHLAEFWMIEPEMAFYEARDNQDLAEEFIKYCVQFALDHNYEDLEFLDKRIAEEEKNIKAEERRPMGLIDTLRFVLAQPFERITYTQAVEILLDSNPYKKKKFQYPVEWGGDLAAEHERYLVEKHFQKPVIVTDYPKQIKAFYMKQNEDGKTVRAMDVLFPGIGEIIGGSQREEDHEKLLTRIREMNLPEKEYWWYLATRQFGAAPHSGFGLGFERLMLFVTGMGNIRDVIPFPRAPRTAEF
jgi:asparaginyl-tRNA synthetase